MFISLCLICLLSSGALASINPYPRNSDIYARKIAGISPKIIITPYVEAGELEKVRNLTAVKNMKGQIESYAGFATVDKACDSNLFFWFFPAENSNWKNAPISVWLQGGPGSSSLFGLFNEIGPFQLNPSNNKISLRKYSWTKASSYIFIDNPVGTGFSYAGNETCYSTNETSVGQNLLVAVKQILQMFPNIKTNPFFITGESYAGKYVPAFAYAIHKDTDKNNRINLTGIAIGNGLVDPYNQLFYSDYLYQLGLIDTNARTHIKNQEDTCRKFIYLEKWTDAFFCFDELLNGDVHTGSTYFQNVTGFNYYFNYLFSETEPFGDVAAYVTKDSVRDKIHVGNSTYHGGELVEKYLMEDVMKSVKPWLEELLEHYRVLLYNGQLDIIVAYPLTEAYLKELKWSAADEYKTAERHIWKVEKDIAGYVKKAGKLTEILFRNAGHIVPFNQPKWAFDLISRFINDKPFF